MFAVCMILQACAWAYLLKPQSTYSQHVDRLMVLFGGMCFIAFFSFGVIALYVLLEPILHLHTTHSPNTLSPSRWRDNQWKVISLCIYLFVLAFLCSFLSNFWRTSAGEYFQKISEYNIVSNSSSHVNEKFNFKVRIINLRFCPYYHLHFSRFMRMSSCFTACLHFLL